MPSKGAFFLEVSGNIYDAITDLFQRHRVIQINSSGIDATANPEISLHGFDMVVEFG